MAVLGSCTLRILHHGSRLPYCSMPRTFFVIDLELGSVLSFSDYKVSKLRRTPHIHHRFQTLTIISSRVTWVSSAEAILDFVIGGISRSDQCVSLSRSLEIPTLDHTEAFKGDSLSCSLKMQNKLLSLSLLAATSDLSFHLKSQKHSSECCHGFKGQWVFEVYRHSSCNMCKVGTAWKIPGESLTNVRWGPKWC